MARLPYLSPQDLDEQDRAVLERPINLFRVLANSPGGAGKFANIGNWIRHECTLDPRLRELAILQVGYLVSSAYEFSHHVRIGHAFGVSHADIEAMRLETNSKPSQLGELESAVLRSAREMTLHLEIDADTWRVLQEYLDHGRLVDLVLVIAHYNAVVRILAALEVDVEPEYLEHLHYLSAETRKGPTP